MATPTDNPHSYADWSEMDKTSGSADGTYLFGDANRAGCSCSSVPTIGAERERSSLLLVLCLGLVALVLRSRDGE